MNQKYVPSIFLSRTLNVRVLRVASLGQRHILLLSQLNEIKRHSEFSTHYTQTFYEYLSYIFCKYTLNEFSQFISVNLLIHYRYLLALEFYKQVHFHRVESNSNRAMSHQVET